MKKNFFLLFIVFLLALGLNEFLLKENHQGLEEDKMNKGYDYVNKVENTKVVEDPTNQEYTNIIEDIASASKEVEVKSEPVFSYTSLSNEHIEKIMGKSYQSNNKIQLEDLAFLQITYWGFDDKEHLGELIVNKKVAEEVAEIFKELHKEKFPIDKIRLIDEYDGQDDLSMADNNSSAFCYREIADSNGKLSNHGYGIAIDINPIQNPYVKNDTILPKEGEGYLDRNNIRKGMIVKGDPCYKAFKKRGWDWGGEWKSLKDFQHFEINSNDLYTD